ncbi:MAG: cation/multidrug efflux pump, partial [Pedosphaera sp.]|nr:cation/multidrug efflux pump [Pedosphaera sp.]
ILSALGETINLMTLGGLALAVGILVDDATVTIENIERHLAAGGTLMDGILDGAGEIAVPAIVSTSCICIVFVPMFLLSGVARYLFVPLAEAVVFAVMASYFLSRTLVPTLVMYFERNVKHGPQNDPSQTPTGPGPQPRPRRSIIGGLLRPFIAVQHHFERGFERFRKGYGRLLRTILDNRVIFAIIFLAFSFGSWLLIPLLGQDFFPSVDAGMFNLHVRARTGTRIESTAELIDRIEAVIRREIPAKDFQGVLDNIGLPVSGINISYDNTGMIGTADANMLVSLNPGHRPTSEYVQSLRLILNREFPGTTFYFLPADIVTQTINFGLPAPIDIQIFGRDQAGNRKLALQLADKISRVPGAVDVRIQQPDNLPNLQVAIDRIKSAEVGLTERDVATAVMLSLTGSGQTTPTYWVDPRVGVEYLVVVMAPQYRMDSMDALRSMPVNASRPASGNVQLLANLASFSRTNTPPIYSHYNVKPVIDVYCGVSGRDLGGVMRDMQPLLNEAEKQLPAGSSMQVRGQVDTMRTSFTGLSIGLVAAIVLIYLLLVVNFQSWLDPFIILTALTGALAGVIWGLHITNTTLSVPAMMGAIMSLGVATANSVLVVTFARSNLHQGMVPLEAAWESGIERLRPVLMTAMAMIIGMIPMALGAGAGGEQNAPLGRAVIGGLVIATFTTLFFVPVVFSLLHRQK